MSPPLQLLSNIDSKDARSSEKTLCYTPRSAPPYPFSHLVIVSGLSRNQLLDPLSGLPGLLVSGTNINDGTAGCQTATTFKKFNGDDETEDVAYDASSITNRAK